MYTVLIVHCKAGAVLLKEKNIQYVQDYFKLQWKINENLAVHYVDTQNISLIVPNSNHPRPEPYHDKIIMFYAFWIQFFRT